MMASEDGNRGVSPVVGVVVAVMSSGGVNSSCGLCSMLIAAESSNYCSAVVVVAHASCLVVCSSIGSGCGGIPVSVSSFNPWAASLDACSVSSISNNWSSLNSSRRFPITVVCILARAWNSSVSPS